MIDISVFNFKPLFQTFQTGKVETVHFKDGYYNQEQGGKWIDGEEIREELALFTIKHMSDDDLKMDEGGTYNSESRKLYCYQKLKKGTKIINTLKNGSVREFEVMDIKDLSDFDSGLVKHYLIRIDKDDY